MKIEQWPIDSLKELKACGYQVSARLMNAMYFSVPQNRARLVFIGIRDGAPSHLSALQHPLTLRAAVSGLSLTVQDESLEHVWVDEVSRKTKWIGRAAKLFPGEKLVPNVASSCRAFWDKPAPTMQRNAMPGSPGYVRNSTIHPSQARTLSVREMARCQSFPDKFRFVDPRHCGMQEIGNSVPPLFMRAIAQHVRAILNQEIKAA